MREDIENCVAYSTFCPQFSNGQLQKQRATSHAVIHNIMKEINYWLKGTKPSEKKGIEIDYQQSLVALKNIRSRFDGWVL